MLFKKSSVKKTIEVIVYIIFILLLFLTWGIRKDFIVGPIPAVIHLGVFYLLYLLIRKLFK